MILGLLFLLIGLSIILKAVFHINLPVFRVGFALFFIYIGVKMLFGDWNWSYRHHSYEDDHTAVFTGSSFKYREGDSRRPEYSVVFGESEVDLTEATGKEPVRLNVVFGSLDVTLDAKKLYSLRGSSVFGDIRTPDGEGTSFGSIQTRIPDQAGEPALRVLAHCVFGEIRFHQKTVEAPANPAPKAGS